MVKYLGIPKILSAAGSGFFLAGNGILGYGEYLQYQGASSEGMKELFVNGYLPMQAAAAVCFVCAALYIKYVTHKKNSVVSETDFKNVISKPVQTIETLVKTG